MLFLREITKKTKKQKTKLFLSDTFFFFNLILSLSRLYQVDLLIIALETLVLCLLNL